MRKLYIATIILSLFLMGADSPQLLSYPPNKIMGFRGLDTRSTVPTIPDSRSPDLKNVKLSEALDLRQRFGYDTINNATLDDSDITSPAITGIFDSVYSDDKSWTIAFLGDKIKYDTTGAWAEVGNWYSSPTITSSDNTLWHCIMALDELICTNDVDVPIKIDSTPSKDTLDISDLSDTLTKAKTSIWFRNYLILGNTVENSVSRPTRFRWSDVGTIETYDDDNFVDIASLAGEEILAFAELYGDIYVFLTKSIWQASLVGGDDIFIFKKVIDGLGTVSRDSVKIVQLPDNRTAVIFLTKRKRILQFNGFAVEDIGEIIQPTLDNLSAVRLQYATATFDGDSYFITVTDGSGTTNDLLLEYNVKIKEWSKHTDINANYLAQVEDANSLVKTYFGNYESMVYWLNNPDLKNDVDGASGIVDSIGITGITNIITGAQVLIDTDLTSGVYTGAIVKINSGTGVGQSRVVLSNTSTSLVVATAFTTVPDSTSVYSVGAIDAQYKAKWYDYGNSSKEKSILGMLIWGTESTSNSVDVTYALDFGSDAGSKTLSLAPATGSLWDSAIWDESVWGTTGDKIYTVKMAGFGNFMQPQFANSNIDETFHLYGFNLLAIEGDTKQ